MIKQTNFRVVVEPGFRFSFIDLSGKEALRMCQDIEAEIKRHVDQVRHISIDCDEVCEFCGYDWEEGDDGQPRCCDEAVKEWLTNKK